MIIPTMRHFQCRERLPSHVNVKCNDCGVQIIRNGKPFTTSYYEDPRGFLQMFTTHHCKECVTDG